MIIRKTILRIAYQDEDKSDVEFVEKSYLILILRCCFQFLTPILNSFAFQENAKFDFFQKEKFLTLKLNISVITKAKHVKFVLI